MYLSISLSLYIYIYIYIYTYKGRLRALGLFVSGTKPMLVERLQVAGQAAMLHMLLYMIRIVLHHLLGSCSIIVYVVYYIMLQY